MYANVAHPQVVIPQRQGVFEDVIHHGGQTFRFMLAGEAQQILHDAMSALGLLVKLFGIFHPLWAHLAAGA